MKGSGKTTAYGSKAKKTSRDEDLQLFREMFKRESERDANLLLDVSEDFEPQTLGNHLKYKLPTLKKDDGNDFLAAEKDSKNDYDWLKTPPATPLFPSLEMEANDPNMMIFHRELPILHSFQPSRFLNKMEEPKFKQRQQVEESKFRQRPKSPGSISSTSSSSSRPETPSARPPSSSGDPNRLGGLLNLPERPKKQSASNGSYKKPAGRPTTPKTTSAGSTTSTRSTTPDTTAARTQSAGLKPGSRGGSPGARPRIRAILISQGFSDEAPPNLITSAAAAQRRPKSATRGSRHDAEQKAESANSRRQQSCSPSVSRGRNVDTGVQISVTNNETVGGASGNGEVVAGSLMVQKMMNARRLTVVKEKKDLQTKNPNSTNADRPDLGKLMSRTSLNMALKQMEMSKNPSGVMNSKHTGIASSNKPTSQTTIGTTRTGVASGNKPRSDATVGSAVNKPRSDATVGSAGRFRKAVKKAESKDWI